MRRLLLILFTGLFISGCAIAVPIKKEIPYTSIHFEDYPTVLVVDLKDTRANKRDVGGMGLAYFVVDIDIASEINNKILKQLAERKFNIKNTSSDTVNTSTNAENIKSLIAKNNANALLTGDLEQFEIPRAADATLQKTDLVSRLFIRLFDADGKKIYQNKIMASTKRYFGLGTVGPAQDLVKDSMNDIVNNLFNDQEFTKALDLLQEERGR